MTEPTTISFEDAYTRLQSISARVTSDEVPVAEMCELFAEGKGLQNACTKYLDEQKSRVDAIERGEGIQAFRIVSPSSDASAPTGGSSPTDSSEWSDADEDFEVQPVTPAPTPASDDDIPF